MKDLEKGLKVLALLLIVVGIIIGVAVGLML